LSTQHKLQKRQVARFTQVGRWEVNENIGLGEMMAWAFSKALRLTSYFAHNYVQKDKNKSQNLS